MIIDQNGKPASPTGKHHATKPRNEVPETESIPGAIAQAGNVIMEEPAHMRNTPEAIMSFLDDETGRQRWEIQRILELLSQMVPDKICLDQRCRTLTMGRMFPHVRTMVCQTESRGS